MAANNLFDCTEHWKPQQLYSIKIPGKHKIMHHTIFLFPLVPSILTPGDLVLFVTKRCRKLAGRSALAVWPPAKKWKLTCFSCCAGGNLKFLVLEVLLVLSPPALPTALADGGRRVELLQQGGMSAGKVLPHHQVPACQVLPHQVPAGKIPMLLLLPLLPLPVGVVVVGRVH